MFAEGEAMASIDVGRPAEEEEEEEVRAVARAVKVKYVAPPKEEGVALRGAGPALEAAGFLQSGLLLDDKSQKSLDEFVQRLSGNGEAWTALFTADAAKWGPLQEAVMAALYPGRLSKAALRERTAVVRAAYFRGAHGHQLAYVVMLAHLNEEERVLWALTHRPTAATSSRKPGPPSLVSGGWTASWVWDPWLGVWLVANPAPVSRRAAFDFRFEFEGERWHWACIDSVVNEAAGCIEKPEIYRE
jgi:hypothetical protein